MFFIGRRQNEKSDEQGFTLIEIMIVITIIGILASIAIPKYSAFRVKTFSVAAANDVGKALVVIEAFYTEYGHYPNSSILATGPVRLTASDGTYDAVWTLTKDVSMLYTKGTSSGFCVGAKHLNGDAIYMGSNLASAPVSLLTPAEIDVKLQNSGAIMGTTDCSNMQSDQIKSLGVL